MNRQTYKQRIDEHIRWIAQAHGGEVKAGDKLISERELNEVVGFHRGGIREVSAVMQYLGMIKCEHGKSKVALVDFNSDWGSE